MSSHKKDKFDCADIEKYVQQYVDGALDDKEHQMFEEHLDYCLPCDKKTEFEKKLKTVVRLKVKEHLSEKQLKNRIDRMLNDLH